jgi:hypothetical protein
MDVARGDEPACRAVVAARVNAPGSEEALLRRLRVRTMCGGLLDDPDLIAGAAREAGLDPDRVAEWSATEEVTLALGADITAARRPAPAADALDHKLGGPREERRYTAPSYEITRPEDGVTAVVPGFNPVEAYEVAIANLAPGLDRRAKPASVEEVLRWAGEPLATAEIAAVHADRRRRRARRSAGSPSRSRRAPTSTGRSTAREPPPRRGGAAMGCGTPVTKGPPRDGAAGSRVGEPAALR